MATSQNIGCFLRLPKQSNVLHFETMEEAVVRVRKQKRQEDLGERKKKRHCLPPNQDNFHKENLLQEVTNMTDGKKVRFFSVQYKFIPLQCIGGPEQNNYM